MASNRIFFFRTILNALIFLVRHAHVFLLIAIPLLAIHGIAAFFMGLPISGEGQAEFSFALFGQNIAISLVGWILAAILAVRWHRRVLLGAVDGWKTFTPFLGRRERKFLLMEILVSVIIGIIFGFLTWGIMPIAGFAIRDFGIDPSIDVWLNALSFGALMIYFMVVFSIASVFLIFPMISLDRPISISAADSLLTAGDIRGRVLLAFSTVPLGTSLSSIKIKIGTVRSISWGFDLPEGSTVVSLISHLALNLLAVAFCATVISLTYRTLMDLKGAEPNSTLPRVSIL